MLTKKIDLSVALQQDLFGIADANIKEIEGALDVTIYTRDDRVEVRGEKEERVDAAIRTLEALEKMHQGGEQINDFTVTRAMEAVSSGDEVPTVAAMKDTIVVTYNGKPIKCRTLGQKRYIEAIKANTITLCIGPAGTGKTYLAVAAAISEYKNKKVERIIMCRPAIEAGEERLGFLPGDLQSKVDPYLRPLYDALDEIWGHESVQRYLENRTLEIAPLAYMRGRTLNNACVIVDESQNMALSTIKMILTRLGEGSKMILTGDVTQIDLPRGTESGLEKSAQLLSGIDDISVVRLNNRDVVRHKLVKEIVKAFEKFEDQKKGKDGNEQKPTFRRK